MSTAEEEKLPLGCCLVPLGIYLFFLDAACLGMNCDAYNYGLLFVPLLTHFFLVLSCAVRLYAVGKQKDRFPTWYWLSVNLFALTLLISTVMVLNIVLFILGYFVLCICSVVFINITDYIIVRDLKHKEQRFYYWMIYGPQLVWILLIIGSLLALAMFVYSQLG